MQIELPIFRQVSRDLGLSPRVFQVWRAAIEFLDVVEFRELKAAVVQHALLRDADDDEAIDLSTVTRALATLVKRGYLCRIEAAAGHGARYRVPLSKRDCEDPISDDDVLQVHDAHSVVTRRRASARVVSDGVL